MTATPGFRRKLLRGQNRPVLSATGTTLAFKLEYRCVTPYLYFGGAPTGLRVPSGKMRMRRSSFRNAATPLATCVSAVEPDVRLIEIWSTAQRYQPNKGIQVNSRLWT